MATVRDGILAPDGPSYKVLVIQANDTLTLKGTQKLVEYATQGLPIVFQGGLPTQINSINGLAQAQANIRSILSFENVYQVPGSLAPALASIGIQPRAKISATANWQTYWRKDNSTSTDYILIFNNDAVWSNGTISFATSKQPFLFNAWTGTQTPIVQYQYSSGYTTIPFSLAGGQTKIVAFKTLESSSSPSTYIMSAPTSVLGYTWSSNSGIAAKMPSSTSVGSFTLSNGKSVSISLQTTGPVIIFSNWTLIAESWTSGADFYNSSTIGIKTNKTFQLPELVSWAQITGLENASGVGYYRTFFSWSKSSGDGAIINFGAPINTLRVRINGEPIPPLDLSDARADISVYLKEGANTVDAIIATTLYNALYPIYGQLRSGDIPPYIGPNTLPTGFPTSLDSGLVGNVTLTLYNLVEIAG